MTTDAFGRVLFTQGEEIVAEDFNGASGRLLSSVWDQLVYASLPREAFNLSIDSAFNPTSSPYAFALTISGGRPIQGSANNKVKVSAGVLMQAVGTLSGTEPQLLAYSFSGNDEVTIANGDATNPRVDIVQMKLEYVEDTTTVRNFEDAITHVVVSTSTSKCRRVQCVLSVKQGGASVTPLYPIPDVGHVVIAGIVVGAAYSGTNPLLIDDTAGANAVLHDQRMPLRVRPHATWLSNFVYDAGQFQEFFGTVSGVHGNLVARLNNFSPQDMIIPCLAMANAGRLVEVDCFFSDGAVETSRLEFMGHNPGISGPPLTVLANANLAGSGSATYFLRRGGILTFQQGHIPAAGPSVSAAGNHMGPPIWTNGRRAPGQITGEISSSVQSGALALVYVDPVIGSGWVRATFYIAEGM